MTNRGFRIYLGAVCIMLLLIWGCSTPEERARKLINQGRYEEVVASCHDSALVYEARCKIAERLLSLNCYNEILGKYGDTPSASDARIGLAERLLRVGLYEQILANYAYTPAAVEAKRRLAERCIEQGQYEEVVEKYGDTPAADSARALLRKEEAAIRRGEMTAREIARLKRDRQEKIEKDKRIDETLKRWKNCRTNPSQCLRIGMGQWEVSSALGDPNDINRSVFWAAGSQHTREQWVYEKYEYRGVYVYLEDGILTGWQE